MTGECYCGKQDCPYERQHARAVDDWEEESYLAEAHTEAEAMP